jgi:RimJ/RimL family protein N-acetyltransferase
MTNNPSSDWRAGLPILTGPHVCCREAEPGDAASLAGEFADAEVRRFIAKPPESVDGFEKFLQWAIHERRDGRGLLYAVLTAAPDLRLAGLISLRMPHVPGAAWNWGFVFGARSWGTGLFGESSRLVLRFVFASLGLPELEAWSPLANGRAHRALAKLGAEPELRRDAEAPDGRRGHYIRWTITPEDLRRSRNASAP